MEKLRFINQKVISVKPFYCGPELVNGASSVNLLTENLGTKKGSYKTFKTGYVSATADTKIKRVSIKLKVKGERVFLQIENSLIRPYWKVANILKMIKEKNPQIEISKDDVKRWVTSGILTVKFNIDKKNHGTIWKFDKKRYQFVCFLSNSHKSQVNGLIDFDDFFADDYMVL